jgi:hypothetical protein
VHQVAESGTDNAEPLSLWELSGVRDLKQLSGEPWVRRQTRATTMCLPQVPTGRSQAVGRLLVETTGEDRRLDHIAGYQQRDSRKLTVGRKPLGQLLDVHLSALPGLAFSSDSENYACPYFLGVRLAGGRCGRPPEGGPPARFVRSGSFADEPSWVASELDDPGEAAAD